MASDTILDARLTARIDPITAVQDNERFAADVSMRGHLAHQLLLYNILAIPTIDFGVVPALVGWLGEGLFREMLSAGVFRFVHRQGMLGYAGNGNSIVTFVVEPNPGKTVPWWQDAIFRESDIAVERQISARFPEIGSSLRSVLVSAVLENTHELRYSQEFFKRNVVEESYRDVMGSQPLSDLVRAEHPGQRVDLTRLPAVGPDKLRLHGRGGNFDSVDLLMRVAEINLELAAASLIGGADLFTVDGAQELLRNKMARNGVSHDFLEGFVRLVHFHRVPDIGTAVAIGNFPFAELWRLRNRTEAVRFRGWLRNIQVHDPEDVTAEYIAALRREPRSASWPVRIFRLAVTTAIGALGTGIGLAASGVDSFFVDRYLNGFSPKLFLDELERLNIPDRPSPASPRIEVLGKR